MPDGNVPLLFRLKPQHAQQSAQWRQEDSVGFADVPLEFGGGHKLISHRSNYHTYGDVDIDVPAVVGVNILGDVELQPTGGSYRSILGSGVAPGPSITPQLEVQHRPQGILSAFVSVCERWGLTRDNQSKLLGFPPGDFVAEGLLGGRFPASSQDVRERVGYVVGISIALGGLFGRNQEAELAWLSQRRAALDGKNPLQCMLQRRMVNLIQVSELLRQERGL